MLVNTKIGKRKNRAAEAIQNPLAFFRSLQNITWTGHMLLHKYKTDCAYLQD